MIRIICEDTEKGFSCDATMEGTDTMIAQQLNSIMVAVAQKRPKIIEVMNYLQENKLSCPEVEREDI